MPAGSKMDLLLAQAKPSGYFRSISGIMYLRRGECQEDGARFFIVMPSNRMRSNDRKPKHKEFHLNMRKNFFALKGDRALEQTARVGNGFSLIEDIQNNPPGHIPVQPAPGDPTLAGGLDEMIFRNPFQT
ncbi:hypothetical protein HGM15179_003361 [Zosterops borbonicus]|uniref:Uncharacterized protein n=1 Tax=Zosterops borbonicus TaxID=364589 RepID=A0A8K1GTX7_9PASS|nr:hypothetical protein HGM15179_003361 [Zosterops borbonicus]